MGQSRSSGRGQGRGLGPRVKVCAERVPTPTADEPSSRLECAVVRELGGGRVWVSVTLNDELPGEAACWPGGCRGQQALSPWRRLGSARASQVLSCPTRAVRDLALACGSMFLGRLSQSRGLQLCPLAPGLLHPALLPGGTEGRLMLLNPPVTSGPGLLGLSVPCQGSGKLG